MNCILMFAVLISSTFALPSLRPNNIDHAGSLTISSKLTCDCLHAEYTVGNITLVIRSDLQEERQNSVISRIYLLVPQKHDDEKYKKLSELSLPAKYLHARQVKGLYCNYNWEEDHIYGVESS